MYISPYLALTCPLDGRILERQGSILCCENGHSFDIAKQGYVNLLPVQHKKSKEPGDSKEMIAARGRFLNAGFYNVIAEKLNELIVGLISEKEHVNILDAGCGDGFYLDSCWRHVEEKYPDTKISCLGLDIAKPAIISAAKRNENISWVVGTNKSPPVVAQSVDIVLCMFGFCDLAVLKNILSPDGYLILVDAGAEHLLELRRILYPKINSVKKKEDFSGFELIDKSTVKYTIQLKQDEITDLLVMTPHLYRANREGKAAAHELTDIQLTVDVVFRILRLA